MQILLSGIYRFVNRESEYVSVALVVETHSVAAYWWRWVI